MPLTFEGVSPGALVPTAGPALDLLVSGVGTAAAATPARGQVVLGLGAALPPLGPPPGQPPAPLSLRRSGF